MDTSQVKRIAVIGAGLMGHGIALEFAVAGYQVRLTTWTRIGSGRRSRMSVPTCSGCRPWAAWNGPRIDPALAAITTSTDLGRAVAGAELVIEAIVEDLEAKHTLLRCLSRSAGTTA